MARVFAETRIVRDRDGKTHWPKLGASSPYVLAAEYALTDLGLSNVSYARLHPEVKIRLLRSRGTRAGLPTGPALSLLQGVCGKATVAGLTGTLANMRIMSMLKLVHRIPPVPRVSRSYYKTSPAGIELMEYWRETDKRFEKFFAAYTNEREIARIKGWAAALAMGLEIDLIEDREARAAIMMEKIEEEERMMAQAKAKIKMQAQQGMAQIAQLYSQQVGQQFAPTYNPFSSDTF